MPHARAPPAGIYPPLVNFFHEDSSLDLDSIKQHAVRTAKAGVTGLVIMGSNGEAMHLEREERVAIVSTIRKALDAEGLTSFPLIIGCGQQSKRSTLLTIQDAKDAGGDFALVLPPSYWPVAMSKPNVTKYFKELADESALPILIYNFPLVANGVTVDSDQMIELAKHDNIVGCKLTCGVSRKNGLAQSTSADSSRTWATCTARRFIRNRRSLQFWLARGSSRCMVSWVERQEPLPLW